MVPRDKIHVCAPPPPRPKKKIKSPRVSKNIYIYSSRNGFYWCRCHALYQKRALVARVLQTRRSTMLFTHARGHLYYESVAWVLRSYRSGRKRKGCRREESRGCNKPRYGNFVRSLLVSRVSKTRYFSDDSLLGNDSSPKDLLYMEEVIIALESFKDGALLKIAGRTTEKSNMAFRNV